MSAGPCGTMARVDLTDAQRLERRYPAARTPKRLWIPAALSIGLPLLAWTIWAGVNGATPDVVAQVHSFKVVSDTQIDVNVTVQRDDPNTTVSCTVSAQAVTYDTVGERPFTWTPTGQSLQTQWVSVKTFKQATSAQVKDCRVVR